VRKEEALREEAGVSNERRMDWMKDRESVRAFVVVEGHGRCFRKSAKGVS
jgi:hypothetical protein